STPDRGRLVDGMGVDAVQRALSYRAVATAFLALRHVSSAEQSTMNRPIVHENSERVRRSVGEHRVTAAMPHNGGDGTFVSAIVLRRRRRRGNIPCDRVAVLRVGA